MLTCKGTCNSYSALNSTSKRCRKPFSAEIVAVCKLVRLAQEGRKNAGLTPRAVHEGGKTSLREGESTSISTNGSSTSGTNGSNGPNGRSSAEHQLKAAEQTVENTAKEAGREAEGTAEENSNLTAKLAAPLGLVLGLGALLGGGYLFKDQLRTFIDYFIKVAEQWGPLGYLAYGGVYTALEVLAVPAVPLTMTAGVIFGPVPGVIVVSGASTAAATLSFLIARYAARDRVLELAEKNNKFKAIDKAIGKNGLKVVTLLRLSPLLPLSLSNYFYGLTSVDLPSYILGSWVGMLPGTVLYVLAGDYGRELLDSDDGLEGGLPVSRWQVGLGIAVTIAILGYVGRIAKKALDEAEAEEA